MKIPWIIIDVESTKFFIHPRDKFIGKTLMKGKFFEEESIEIVLKYISNNKNIIDIGANLGNHSILFSRFLSNQNKIVYAFEPQRLIHQQLCANLVINGIHNVHTYQYALGHTNTTVTLSNIIEDNFIDKTQNKEIDFDRGDIDINYGGLSIGKGGEEVEMRTLDSFNFTNIGLIKIDVEGAERLVTYGALETIKKNRPFIWVEITLPKIESENILEAFSKDDIPNKSIKNFGIINYLIKELNYDSYYKIENNYNFLISPVKINV